MDYGFVKHFLDFLDSRQVFHRFTLTLTLWVSYRSFIWAADYAEHTTRVGLEVAAIIAAVLTPITYLQKTVFEQYSTSRKGP